MSASERKRPGRRIGGQNPWPGRVIQGGKSLRRRPRKQPRWLRVVAAACLALALGLAAWTAVERALAPTCNTAQDRFDVLIVLGSPADSDGNPTPMEFERVSEAVHEYERGVAPRLILTGGAVRNRFVEARVMARVAEAQGVPASAIVIEPDARNTIENTCNSVHIMRSRGWDSAEIVSSPSHLPRAGLILIRLPIQWRLHAAPALEPEGAFGAAAAETMEVLKTVRYLVWSRQMEPCRL